MELFTKHLEKNLLYLGVSDRFHCNTKYNLIFLEKQVQSTTDSLKNKEVIGRIWNWKMISFS